MGNVEQIKKTIRITPFDDNLIVKVIAQSDKIGSIVMPSEAIEPSSFCEIIAANSVSYNRDGTKRPVTLRAGMKIRIPKGKVGTRLPESPPGEIWLCIPEDVIYYIVD